jgi:hypothetical protein
VRCVALLCHGDGHPCVFVDVGVAVRVNKADIRVSSLIMAHTPKRTCQRPVPSLTYPAQWDELRSLNTAHTVYWHVCIDGTLYNPRGDGRGMSRSLVLPTVRGQPLHQANDTLLQHAQ